MTNETGKKILLVDDEDDLLLAIETFLSSRGFSVKTANNGLEATSLLDKEDFDVIVSDVKMPKSTGIELLKSLPSKNKLHIPVILISGFSETTMPEALGFGAYDLLAKPFDFQVLINALTKALSPSLYQWDEILINSDSYALIEHAFLKSDINSNPASFFGRGGVFIPMNEGFPDSFETCRFSIKMSDDNSFEFLGHGTVRWVRRQQRDFLPTGIGIEIRYLSEKSRSFLENLLKNQPVVSYIPLGQKKHNI